MLAIAREASHTTSLHAAHSIFGFSTFLVDLTEQRLTQACLTEHEHLILLFHQGNTTWPMPDLRPVVPLLSHINECDIILLSGVGPTSGMLCFATANHLLIAFRPSNEEELFNLRHACARNVIERIFGILKRRFTIFSHPPEYNMKLQVRLPPALGAVHNFICIHDPEEIDNFADISDEGTHERYGTLALGPAGHAERLWVAENCDEIAERMWVQYQAALHGRNI
jgi:hypothetical protein